ncbi:helix-turn-helix domain-containing protein [Planctellipticum variicoloris]|uniref:helix-turn-helix domain-containing protein n=1 Tax=Planctellipticum variicoloris TaxID=3064265 RepID=UPI00301385D8|nr:helix-turn-helix domain-containing protein [Planctomycetaceae bacterium SH412]
MMAKRLGKRVIGKLPADRAVRLQQSWKEAEAERDATAAESRQMLRELVQLPVKLGDVLKLLRELRVSSGKSAKEVADAMHMNSGNYSRLERGQGNPTVETLERLANAINAELIVSVRPRATSDTK